MYVGVDPGASGGVAVLWDDHLMLCNMPDTEDGLWELFRGIAADYPSPLACVEQVGGFMGQSGPGGKSNKAAAHTMFNFGRGYGSLCMALHGNGIAREFVTPAKWQRALGVPPRDKNDTQAAHKRRLKERACQLYPGVKVTLSTCDAVLLATYIQRKRTGTL